MTEIGKEYGAALFLLAREENRVSAFAKGLEIIGKNFREYPEYPMFLSSPGIPIEQRLSAISAAFAESVPESVLSFLQLLCEKGRIPCFFAAKEEFDALFQDLEHVTKAKVTAAIELNESEKQALKEKLETLYQGKVELSFSIDPGLLGGLVVEADGKIIDGSLRQRLQKFREVMNT